MKKIYLIFCTLALFSCKKEIDIIQPQPSTSTVFYLDFDGYTFTTFLANGGKPFSAPATNLTQQQKNLIVSEVQTDYAKYNVIITTDSTVFLKASQYKRSRAIITTNLNWVPPANTGWSWVGSMSEKVEMPCYILADKLPDIHFLSQIVSHELGHTVGLYHQSTYDETCKKTSEYNYGDGTTAPLMGCSVYSKNRGTWWVGTSAQGCNVIQNDDLILTQKLGLNTK